MPASLAVACIVVALVAAAFFAGAETALTAASRARLRALETAGDARATLVARLVATRSRLISSMLLGGQLVTIAASALATNVLVSTLGERGVVYATVIMTALIVVFGEVLPKTIAIAYPDRVSLLIAPAVSFFVTVFGPIVTAVEALVRFMLRLCGVNLLRAGRASPATTNCAARSTSCTAKAASRATSATCSAACSSSSEVTVSDVMVHRTKMRTLDADLPPDELVREVLASPYTRMPLWRGDPDNIIGVLHAKDLFRAFAAAGGDASRINAADIALEAWFVPEATTLRDQLQAFLRRKTHSALVVDEYGVVLGLLTLEDIIEEIVGDIKDEHDVVVQGVRKQLDGSIIVDGSVTIRDLNRAMDWNLPDEEAATVAGLVIHEARAIPEPKQTFSFHGMRFEVLRKQRNRIAALRIAPLDPRDGGPAKTEATDAAAPPGEA